MSRSSLIKHPKYASLIPHTASCSEEGGSFSHRQLPVWRIGQLSPRHTEIFADCNEATGAAVAFSLAYDVMKIKAEESLTKRADRRKILWVQEISAVRLNGRPYIYGLPRELRNRLIYVEAKSSRDALFSLEEGLRCRDIGFVLGEIVGNPRVLDFTASKRLSMVAEEYGIPLWLVRLNSSPDLSSARMRWKVTSAPSDKPLWNSSAPGTPSWYAALFRARSHPTGEWRLSDDGVNLIANRQSKQPEKDSKTISSKKDNVCLVRKFGSRSLASL